MNFIIKKSLLILSIPLFLFGASSCKNNNAEQTKTASETTHQHEEEAPTVASLTPAQIKAVGVTLGKVENKELTATLKANGHLRVPNSSKGNITALYGGVVKALNVQIGDKVAKGEVIATIANSQFVQLQEEYLSIDSKILLAKQELTRQKELYEGNAGALKNLQSATADLNTLQTRKASLQKQIQLLGIAPNAISLNTMRSNIAIKSPLDGVISNVFANIGSYVNESTPIAEVVDNHSLHLDLQIFEKDLPLLKVGQIIHFTLTNNPTSEYDAVVYSIGSSFENDSKTIAVHCKVTGNKTGLIDGMNVTAIVSLNNATTPAVPNDAIVSSDGKDYIFVVTNKQPEVHEEAEAHAHGDAEHAHEAEKEPKNDNINFEKVEIVKGTSNMGYTAVHFVHEIPKGAQIVVKGAFFVNAKLTNTREHEH